MAKLATLKLVRGSLEEGIEVALTTSNEGSTEPDIDTDIYYLPPNPDLAETLNQWQSNYRGLTDTRMQTGWQSLSGTTAESRDVRVNEQLQQEHLNNLRNLDRVLRSQISDWMESRSFSVIRDTFLTELTTEEVRILVRSGNKSLLEIPWHLWDLIDTRNRQAEVALSAFDTRPTIEPNNSRSHGKVRILAIMGNSEGIDTKSDEQSVRNLPNVDPVFLHEEEWSTIHSHLWKQNWDILFFAGHSFVENGQARFCINRNKNDNPTIDDFRHAIRRAVENGLQLAIFNSCDGLKLGFDLQKLHLPHSIVMRYPIPDRIAQNFLSCFLTNFANGQSLYLAERDARGQLEGAGNEFPGASWLPVIVQSPAAHRHSLTWKDLSGMSVLTSTKPASDRWWLKPGIIISMILLIVTLFINFSQHNHEAGDHEKTLEPFNKAIHLNPNAVKGYIRRGNAYFEFKEYDKALKDFNKAIQLNPNAAEGYTQRGRTYYDAFKEYDKALKDFNKAVQLNPSAVKGYIRRGNAYFTLEKNDKALEDFNQVIAINPEPIEAAQAYHSLGNVLSKMIRYPEAQENFKRAMNLYEALNDRKKYLEVKQQIARIKIMNNYNKTSPVALNYFKKGDAYRKSKDYDKAIFNFDKAIALDPKNAKFYNYKGMTYSNNSKPEEALKYYILAIKIYPVYALAYNNRGLTYIKLNQLFQARQDLQKAADLYKQQGDIRNHLRMLQRLEEIK